MSIEEINKLWENVSKRLDSLPEENVPAAADSVSECRDRMTGFWVLLPLIFILLMIE